MEYEWYAKMKCPRCHSNKYFKLKVFDDCYCFTGFINTCYDCGLKHNPNEDK